MISSMTGFGAADGAVGESRASVEIRTVNHRFFSPNLKLPSAFSRWEGEIRELLRQKIARGHVTLTVRIDREAATGPVIDEARLAQYAVTLKELQKKLALGGEVDLATLLRLPEVISGAERRGRSCRRTGARGNRGQGDRESDRRCAGRKEPS